MMTVIVKNMLTVIMMMMMMMTMIEMGKMDDDTGVVGACYPVSAELRPLPAW